MYENDFRNEITFILVICDQGALEQAIPVELQLPDSGLPWLTL